MPANKRVNLGVVINDDQAPPSGLLLAQGAQGNHPAPRLVVGVAPGSAFCQAKVVRLFLATTCFATYFTVTQTGGKGIENFFHLSPGSAFVPITILGVLASLTAAAFYFRALDGIQLKPKNLSEYYLLVFTPFAAAPNFTGAYLGAGSLGAPPWVCILDASVSFFIRFSVVWDGAIKCPVKLKEMKQSLVSAYENGDVLNFLRLFVASLMAVGYSLSVSDSIYAAVSIIFSWLGVTSNVIPYVAYAASGLGVVGTFPYILYWMSLGLDMLTNGKNFDSSMTDRYTFIAALMSLPGIVGVLGTASSASGEVFAKLGTTAKVVRFGSSVCYGIAVNTIAFSGIARSIGKDIVGPAISSCYNSLSNCCSSLFSLSGGSSNEETRLVGNDDRDRSLRYT